MLALLLAVGCAHKPLVVGVPACDAYADRVRADLAGLDPADVPEIEASLRDTLRAWKRLPPAEAEVVCGEALAALPPTSGR